MSDEQTAKQRGYIIYRLEATLEALDEWAATDDPVALEIKWSEVRRLLLQAIDRLYEDC